MIGLFCLADFLYNNNVIVIDMITVSVFMVLHYDIATVFIWWIDPMQSMVL